MAQRRPLRAALYARLSVNKDESVSIEHQLEAARKYAESRGWRVVLEASDGGVSASRIKPEQRVGWRSIMDSSEPYDVVVVWKVDRLARRVIDFLNVAEKLKDRGALLAAVMDQIDLTSSSGQAYATMMAVFGQMEASAMSERATAARAALLKGGRRAGGKPPFGWMNVPNPDGPGMVLAKDPDRIGVVSSMVSLAMEGTSIYGIRRWLESEGVQPRARAGKVGAWHDATVEDMLRNPVLAGMVRYAQGRKRGEKADDNAVLRDELGLPIVDPTVAIISTEERRELLAILDSAKRPGSRPRSGTPPFLLAALVRCASCEGPLYRATASSGKVRQLRCQRRGCTQPVTAVQGRVEDAVVSEFLRVKGDDLAVRLDEVPARRSPRVGDIEQALRETADELIGENPDYAAIVERAHRLHEELEDARLESGVSSVRTWTYETRTNREAWEGASSVEDQRQVLLGALDRVLVMPSGGRRGPFDQSRLVYEWAETPEVDVFQVAPLVRSSPSSESRRR